MNRWSAILDWVTGRGRGRHAASGPSYQLELLDSLYNNSPVAFAVIDRQGRFLDINGNPMDMFGYRKEEMAGQSFLRLLDPSSYEVTFEAFNRTINGEKCSQDIRIRHQDGHPIDLNISTSPLVRRGKIIGILVFMQDISERRRTLEGIRYLAFYDDMTGLPNRRFFRDRLEEKLKAARDSGMLPAVCYVDVDGFKLVNASFGREFGDMLMLQVAERLMRCFPDPGDVARLEGDEFVGYLGDVREPSEAAYKVEETMRLLAEPFELNGVPLHLSVSVGYAVGDGAAIDAATLMKKADTALNRVKENGKNNYLLHSEDMDPVILNKLTIQHEMRKALINGDFLLHYQPQYDLASGQIVGMEALLRWRHPERGLISPCEFIPAAEESGMIIPLGDWVLEEACRQNKLWQTGGLPPIPVSVNLSMRQFFRGDLTAKVADVLKQSGLDARYLELEITESMTMDVERASVYLTELTELGVKISIDDFGTGYSSFHYLKSLPITRLKIDRSFVRDLQHDPGDAAIVAAIIAMAHNLQLQVIAEGVESAEQVDFLRRHRCDEMQGYFGSPPLEAGAAGELLQEKRNGYAIPQ